MANTITGKVLSVGQPLQIAGRDPQRPLVKREIVIDCTRHDPYTGERSTFENTPLLEFVGDITAMLNDVQPDDIVTVHIDVVGTRYTDKATQQPRIFTRVRPYKLEVVRKAAQGHGQQARQGLFDTPQTPSPGMAPAAAQHAPYNPQQNTPYAQPAYPTQAPPQAQPPQQPYMFPPEQGYKDLPF